MKNWTQDQVNFLRLNYGKIPVKEISLKIDKSPSIVYQTAFRLKINKINYEFWSDKDVELLINLYPSKSFKELLIIFPDRTKEKIKAKAKELKIKRNNRLDQIKGNVSSLLLNTPLAFYWIGFILADGHISKNNRLSVVLNKQDKEHLSKFAKFINGNINTHKHTVYVRIMDNFLIPKLVSKFDINSKKTYFPPSLDRFLSVDDDLLFSMFIGFIDGDGNIQKLHERKNSSIRIKCHSSWFPFLYLIKSKFTRLFNIDSGNPRVNKQGYSFVSFGNNQLLLHIKFKAIELNLPILCRKWKNI